MVFGKTYEQERARISIKEQAKVKEYYWFAWYPILLDSGKWAWLEWVWIQTGFVERDMNGHYKFCARHRVILKSDLYRNDSQNRGLTG